MKIVIGTKSKRKINTVKKVISQILPKVKFEILSYPSISGVSETPWDKDTINGAKNRAKYCKNKFKNADYYIGLESGLVERFGQVYEEVWACILNNDNIEYYGFSSGLKVPDYIINKMNKLKIEHRDVMDIIYKDNDINDNDTWGAYSNKMINRNIGLEEALRNACIQIFAPPESLYRKK